MTDTQTLEILKHIVNGNLGKARELSEKYNNKYNSQNPRWEVEKIIADEFSEFERVVINSCSKSEIFNKAGEIFVKTEIAEFFENIQLSEEQYAILLKANSKTVGSLIGLLYEFYINNEYANVGSYADIEDWIGWFCDREKELMKND